MSDSLAGNLVVTIHGAGSFSTGDLLAISIDDITLPNVSEYTSVNIIISY